jgi:hypothetical protein
MTEEITHLSHSALGDLQECGEKFRLKRVVKVPRLPAWALVGGTAVHNCTEARDLNSFGIPNDKSEEFQVEFEKEIAYQEEKSGIPQQEWRASGRASVRWPNKENREWWELNGPKFADAWENWLSTSGWKVYVLGTGEISIELELDTDLDGTPVVGKIDRILEHVATGELLMLDLKAGARKPDKPKQLVTYGHLLRDQYGENVKYGAYFWNRKSELVGPWVLAEYDDGRLEHEYAAGMAQVKDGRYMPSEGQHCGWCDVKDFCYAVGGPRASEVRPY